MGVSMSVVLLSSRLCTSLDRGLIKHDDTWGERVVLKRDRDLGRWTVVVEGIWEAEGSGVVERQTVEVNLGTRKILAWECMRTAWLDVGLSPGATVFR